MSSRHRLDAGTGVAGIGGGLTVPPGQSTQVGHCTIPTETTILSVGAHMHTHGVSQTVTAYPTPDAPIVLADGPYNFTEQRSVWLDTPQVIAAGGSIDVACTYQNDTNSTLIFGESTDNEMCYAGIYHYPRFQDGSTCVQ